jgi:hypothetical protein
MLRQPGKNEERKLTRKEEDEAEFWSKVRQTA